jgi:hypothetical protein
MVPVEASSLSASGGSALVTESKIKRESDQKSKK